MSDPIVEAVARRWKLASDVTWFTDAEEIDFDSVAGYFKDDSKLVRWYKAKCVYLAPIFRSLAAPLEAPALSKYADLMDKRVTEVDQLMTLVGEGVKLTKRAQEEFDQLLEDLADEKPRRGGLIEAVHDLPAIEAIMKVAKEAGNLHDRLTKEDDDTLIDWTLEEYLGPESGIQRKIEKAGEPMRGWFAGGSNFSGAGTLYGFVKYLTDPKYIQDNVDQIRADREPKPEV